MRKIFAAIMFIFLFSSLSYGAVSDDIYVRKDVFEVYMQNINSKMDNILEELKAQRNDINELIKSVAVLSERVDRNFDTLSKRIDDNYVALSKRIDDNYVALSKRIDDNYASLDSRIADLRNGIYLILVLLGLIVAFPSARKFLQWREERKLAKNPSFTLEDVEKLVERLIDAKLSMR